MVVSPQRVPFLFDPADVRRVLAECPALAATQNPGREGVKAEWFEGIRKSERQLYRVLGNTHYEHLAALLHALNLCLEHDFNQPRLLRARTRSSFAPDLAELHVAEHFAIGGCEITGFDDTKGGESVPDVLVQHGGFSVAVEVYCPLQWEHLERFQDDLRTAVKNVDLPFDFAFRLAFEKLHEFDEHHRLLHLHSGDLDDALAREGRGIALANEFVAEFLEQLDNPSDSFEIAHEAEDLNLKLVLELEHIVETREGLPARGGVINGPDAGSHRPERVFARIVELAAEKAAKGQALAVEVDAAVLVVYLDHSDLFSELRNDGYRQMFLKIIEEHEDETRKGHTAIVFADTDEWGKPFIPWFLNNADDAPRELYDVLDPRGLLPRPPLKGLGKA